MSDDEYRPDWWPQCPYPEDVFPMTTEEYAAAVPDEKLRTAISGFLCRLGWEVASEAIWKEICENISLYVRK